MSVAKDKRGVGRLAVNTTARGICLHILKITENKKKFPEAHADLVATLRRMALEIDLKCWRATNIVVDNSERLYQTRLQLEWEAAVRCTDIIELINIMKPIIHMDNKRYLFISEQYANLRTLIWKQFNSDSVRLAPK